MTSRKRKREAKRRRQSNNETDHPSIDGLAATVAQLRAPELPLQNNDNGRDKQHPSEVEDNDSDEWTVVGKASKRQKTNNYPTLVYNELHKQNAIIKIVDLQNLILYCAADGASPQWISVRHHYGVKKVVVLFVPGLEKGMFNGTNALDEAGKEEEKNGSVNADMAEESQQNVLSSILDHQAYSQRNPTSPDDYLPMRLASEKLPASLSPLANLFGYLWPVKAPGDDRYSKVFSPLHAMLNAHLPKSQEEKVAEKKVRGAKPVDGRNWPDNRTPITAYISDKEELQENDYILHPTYFLTEAEKAEASQRRETAKQSKKYGWKDTLVERLEDGEVQPNEVEQGSITAGRTILAMDCEMCKTEDSDAALTRISLVDWNGEVVMDELVKPDKPILDYLTPYSGITAEQLNPITTTLTDIQERLLTLLTSHTILIGHSLDSDLNALKITHPFIIDTSILYQHPRGPPLKSSLKWLAQKYLGREIQKGHGTLGHDSVEDSRACLDLVKLKCEKGPKWGNRDFQGESIFKRLSRTPKSSTSAPTVDGSSGKTGAIVDRVASEKSFGQMASVGIGCLSDAEVVQGVKRAVFGDPDGDIVPGGGVDLTWARLSDLSSFRGWSDPAPRAPSAPTGIGSSTPTQDPALSPAVSSTVSHIQEIHSVLPPCTLLVVYTGTGDPRPLAQLQEMQRTFKREYKEKKWDELSVQWTDKEEQAMKRACRMARQGLGFVAIT